MRFINIGFGNLINADRVVSVVSPDSAPVKRMIQLSKDRGTLIDATQGRKTKSVLITDSDNVILSYLQPDSLAGRFNEKDSEQQE